jgi:hypothetical protein
VISFAFLGVDQDGTILVFLIKGTIWAGLYTDRILAVKAHHRQRTEYHIWEIASFPLIDAHPLDRAWRNVMPLHTGDGTLIATDTPTLINKETVLGHWYTPLGT